MVEFDKIKEKLISIQNDLKELSQKENLNPRDDGETYNLIYTRICTYIRRIYPNYDDVIKGFFPHREVVPIQINQLFKQLVKNSIGVIDIIIEEFEVFGDDFTPTKEKIETEWEAGTKGFNFRKKKINK